jgi:hypothetical protein
MLLRFHNQFTDTAPLPCGTQPAVAGPPGVIHANPSCASSSSSGAGASGVLPTPPRPAAAVADPTAEPPEPRFSPPPPDAAPTPFYGPEPPTLQYLRDMLHHAEARPASNAPPAPATANAHDGHLPGTPPVARATPATPPHAAPSLPPTPTETLLPDYVEAARTGSPQDYGGADMDVAPSPPPTAQPPLKASPSPEPPPRLAHPSAEALSASRPAISALDCRPQQPYLSRAPPELALSWLPNSSVEIRRAFEIAGGNRTAPEELRPKAERILRETRMSSGILLHDVISLSRETDPRNPWRPRPVVPRPAATGPGPARPDVSTPPVNRQLPFPAQLIPSRLGPAVNRPRPRVHAPPHRPSPTALTRIPAIPCCPAQSCAGHPALAPRPPCPPDRRPLPRAPLGTSAHPPRITSSPVNQCLPSFSPKTAGPSPLRRLHHQLLSSAPCPA